MYDAEAELYYLNARYYDPEDGRFLTQDTYRGEKNEQGTWHLYGYCANNPNNYVDPSGHQYVSSSYSTTTRIPGQYIARIALYIWWKVKKNNGKLVNTSIYANWAVWYLNKKWKAYKPIRFQKTCTASNASVTYRFLFRRNFGGCNVKYVYWYLKGIRYVNGKYKNGIIQFWQWHRGACNRITF